MCSHLTDTIIHNGTKIHPHAAKSPRSASNYCLAERRFLCCMYSEHGILSVRIIAQAQPYCRYQESIRGVDCMNQR